jgi:hypothetical protein
MKSGKTNLESYALQGAAILIVGVVLYYMLNTKEGFQSRDPVFAANIPEWVRNLFGSPSVGAPRLPEWATSSQTARFNEIYQNVGNQMQQKTSNIENLNENEWNILRKQLDINAQTMVTSISSVYTTAKSSGKTDSDILDVILAAIPDLYNIYINSIVESANNIKGGMMTQTYEAVPRIPDTTGGMGQPYGAQTAQLSHDTLVPVGLKIACKLSDLQVYMPRLDASMFNSIPPGGLILILDATTGVAVWDPVTTFRKNGTIQPFPSSTTQQSYILYTNAIKFSPSTDANFPLQSQSDRNAVDKIIYNMLDSLVQLNSISVLGNIIRSITPQGASLSAGPGGLQISAEAISNYVGIINKFTFQNIVYEKYGTTIEHFSKENFENVGAPPPKVYNINRDLIYSDNSIPYGTIAMSLALAGLTTGAIYYFMKNKKLGI